MAINDIYSVRVNMGLPQGAGGFTFWYRETVEFDQNYYGTQSLVEAWAADFLGSLRAFLSTDVSVVSMTCRKHFNQKAATFRERNQIQEGLRPGPSLPNNNSLVVQIMQGVGQSNQNGRVFIPGIAEADTDGGNVVALITTLMETFLDQLIVPVAETSPGVGEWQLGVVSQKLLRVGDASPDWVNSFLPAISLGSDPIIYTNRNRATAVTGADW